MKMEHTKQGSGAAHGGHYGGTVEHHVLPLKVYFAVFGALLVLTVVTVGVSLLGLPEPYAIIVAMLVAIVKAMLVILYFMHLKYDDRFYSVIFGISVLFIGLFFVLTLVDMGSRGLIVPEQENGYFQKYDPSQQAAPAAAPGPEGGGPGP